MVKNRKDLIKNIAIVFLIIMLILTFFSNTIMNYSLPEVATKYVQSGTITAKVRGTGTVEANDPYNIILKESRQVSSVLVKAGDKVEKDQVLVELSDKEGTELETAQKELEALILAYTTSLLAGTISNDAYNNIQNGNISSVGKYQGRIEQARQNITTAQERVDSLTKQISLLSIEGASTNDLNQAKEALKNAQNNLNTATKEATNAQTALDLSLVAKTNSETEASAAKATYDDSREKVRIILGDKNPEFNKSPEVFSTYTNEDIKNELLNIGDFKINDNELNETGKTLFQTIIDAETTYNTAVGSLNTATNDYNQKNTANIAAQAKVTSAQNYVSECNTIITNLEGQSSANKAATLATLNAQKVEADATLSKVQKEQEQLLVDISKELDLSNQNSAIASKQKEVEELRKATIGTTIVAPFAGTITQINKIAGETTSPEEALVVMQADGKGFTLSFSVTNEQAKLINVGDVAELQNSWYYNDVQVKVASIKPDTTDPGKKKLIGFEINGEVQQGQSLSISVGQKSSNYDLIVPNSAIREDNNGKFVLVIESKSSPLGNRYVATRVDIEVLASDDTQTAISAALNANEYVITTATKPVNAGEQVRLTEQ